MSESKENNRSHFETDEQNKKVATHQIIVINPTGCMLATLFPPNDARAVNNGAKDDWSRYSS